MSALMPLKRGTPCRGPKMHQ